MHAWDGAWGKKVCMLLGERADMGRERTSIHLYKKGYDGWETLHCTGWGGEWGEGAAQQAGCVGKLRALGGR